MRITFILSVVGLMMIIPPGAVVAQDQPSNGVGPVERITIYTRDNQCFYSLERSASQHEFEVGPERNVQVVTTGGVSAEVRIRPDRGYEGVRGPRNRLALHPQNNVQSIVSRRAGPGRTEHDIRIRCCQSISPGGGCQQGRWARAEGDPDGPYPDDPDQGRGGPDVQALERPQIPPIRPGGPSMKVVDP